MEMWSLLGIAPTDDLSDIEKAYEQSLRIFHKGDDQEGLQRLRDAYEAAKSHARSVQGRSFLNSGSWGPEKGAVPEEIATGHVLSYKPIASQAPLSDEAVKADTNLSPAASCPDQPDLSHEEPEEQQDMMHQVLSCSSLKKAEGVDDEAYLEVREKAYDCRKTDDLAKAGTYAGLAGKICSGDAELFWHEAQLHISQNNREGALRSLNQYLGCCPDDVKALFRRAELLSKRFQYEKAVEDYQRILSLEPSSRAAMLLLADCHLARKHPETAKKYLDKILAENSKDKAAYHLMVSANYALLEQNRAELKKHPADPGCKRRVKLLKKEMEDRFQAYQPKQGFFGRNAPLLAAFGGILLALFLIFTSLPGRAAPQTYSERKAADEPSWENLILKKDSISLTVDNIINLGLVCSLEYGDNKECKPVFYDLDKIQSQAWKLNDSWGLVFVGETGDKEVILVLNILGTSKNDMFTPYTESFPENGTTNGLRITGKLYKAPSEEMMSSLRTVLNHPKMKGKVGPLLTDIIMVEDKNIPFKPVYPDRKENDVDLARLFLGVGLLFLSLMGKFIKFAKSQ